MAEVDTDAVLSVLKPIWTKKPETASRLRGRLERILAYAKTRSLRSGDNPAVWRGHLSESLPSPRHIEGARPGHHPALPWAQVGFFFEAIRKETSIASHALQFTILSASRTTEVLGARWSEFSLLETTWTVPADRMKSKREHRVPLSVAALEILNAVRPFGSKPNDFVFPGRSTGKGLSSMALLMLLRRMNPKIDDGHRWRDQKTGAAITTHGFRSTFRDWVGEATSWPTDLAEAALAHIISDKTTAAYARGDLFAKRRDTMTGWAEFCMGSKP